MPGQIGNTQKWVTRILAVVVLLLGARTVIAEIRLRSSNAENARLETEKLILQAEADGLVVARAEEVRSFEQLLSDTTSGMSQAFAAQGTRLTTAQARRATLTETVTRLRGRIATEAMLHVTEVEGTELEGDVVATPDSLTAHFETDSTSLVADVVCRIPSAFCAIDYSVTITGRLLEVEGPDGSVFVTAEMDQKDVEFEIPRLTVVAEKEPWGFWKKTSLTCAVGAAPGAGLGYLVQNNLGSVVQGALFGCAAGQLGRFIF